MNKVNKYAIVGKPSQGILPAKPGAVSKSNERGALFRGGPGWLLNKMVGGNKK